MRTHRSCILQGSLLVVSNDSFEKITETFVTTNVVPACHLQKQLFERVQTSKLMPCDRVREPCTEHHELVLLLAFPQPAGSAHGAVKTSQLATRSRIHVAHTGDYGMRLIVKIQAVRHQFFEFDLRRPLAIAKTAWSSAP